MRRQKSPNESTPRSRNNSGETREMQGGSWSCFCWVSLRRLRSSLLHLPYTCTTSKPQMQTIRPPRKRLGWLIWLHCRDLPCKSMPHMYKHHSSAPQSLNPIWDANLNFTCGLRCMSSSGRANCNPLTRLFQQVINAYVKAIHWPSGWLSSFDGLWKDNRLEFCLHCLVTLL